MGKKKRSNLFWILWTLVFLLIYIISTNIIETKLIYPEAKDTFSLYSFNYAKNESCLDFGKMDIVYYNKPIPNDYFKQLKSQNAVSINSYVREKCDFGLARISVDIDPKYLGEIYSGRDNFEINKTNRGFEIILRDNETIEFYDIGLIFEINEKFFNNYIFSSESLINILVFTYNTGILKGYYTDEGSFFISQNIKYLEEPVERDKRKRYFFDGDFQNVTLKFNPKLKKWFLIQKILDALILGLIVVFLSKVNLEKVSNSQKRKNSRKNKSSTKKK